MPTLEARGVELAWRERGEGRPILFLHETASTGDVWDAVANALRDRARSIAYDRRGWGASTAPDEYRRTTIEEQSEDAVVLLESVARSPAVLCGAGEGAVIALDLLLRRPDLVAGAVLIEPPLLQLLPLATQALSEDRRRLEGALGEGTQVIDLYLSGVLSALGAGVSRLPDEVAAAGRERPASTIAELGMHAGWQTPLPALAHAERPSAIVTATSTPPLLRDVSLTLGERLTPSTTHDVDAGQLPPHLGAAPEVAEIALELSDRQAAPPRSEGRSP
jgi:pimeloyl-ACP methyl ester carboxylesterase